MPDAPVVAVDLELAETRSSADVLLTALAESVLAVPGVVRLEPTLSTSGPAALLRSRPTDGIRLLDRAGVVDIDVDIATTASCQARAVTHQVQASIASLLPAHGYAVGSIVVSVLTIGEEKAETIHTERPGQR